MYTLKVLSKALHTPYPTQVVLMVPPRVYVDPLKDVGLYFLLKMGLPFMTSFLRKFRSLIPVSQESTNTVIIDVSSYVFGLVSAIY